MVSKTTLMGSNHVAGTVSVSRVQRLLAADQQGSARSIWSVAAFHGRNHEPFTSFTQIAEKIEKWHTWSMGFSGTIRNLHWRYLPYTRATKNAYGSGNITTKKMAKTYGTLGTSNRILKFPKATPESPSQKGPLFFLIKGFQPSPGLVGPGIELVLFSPLPWPPAPVVVIRHFRAIAIDSSRPRYCEVVLKNTVGSILGYTWRCTGT